MRLFLVPALLIALLGPFAAAPPVRAGEAIVLDRPQRADGTSVVPDRFLRRWDPITIFFDLDAGPAAGGAEDQPDRVVTLVPATAGAWQWLDARTLQFRPAEAWKPLQRVEVTAAGRTTRLVPLLPAPIATAPSEARDGIADLDQIMLTFAEPVDIEALARLLTIELRPLPGIDAAEAQVLGAGDFDIKPLERAKRSEPQSYLVKLHAAVPDGRLALLRLRLSDVPGLDDPSFSLALRSAVPFTVSDAGCGRGLTGRTEDGILRCEPNGYGRDDAADQPGTPRALLLSFTAEPGVPNVVAMRDVVRLSPPVDDLAVGRDGSRLKVTGRFQAETVYDLRIDPGTLKDARGRTLAGPVYRRRIAFLADRPSLKWDTAQGIAERLGPQMLPLRGRGYERADIRIHAIDPLGRDFWPFPAPGLETDDDAPPPLAGNEPGRWSQTGNIDADAMIERIKALGSPAVSEIVPLPVTRGGVEAKFGHDVRPLLAKIAGPDQPGTYLVGLRPIDGGKRRWMRLQVTDLALSTVEEATRVHFAVTSLSTARPIADAAIRLEGQRNDAFVTLASGRTDADGGFDWLLANRQAAEIRRIVVEKGADTLVLEPSRGPQEYAQENWTTPEAPWLAWTVKPDEKHGEGDKILCHLFSERPIYRPEEPVHLKGFVRRLSGGALLFPNVSGSLIVTGPGDRTWRYPVTLDEVGGFYHLFDVATEATGDYTAHFEPDHGDEKCGYVTFKKDAYRLPTFEVLLSGAREVPLDGEFSVDLLARYFAGGLVAGRPIRWRVTQFPYAWTPPGREGFLFSSDSRFSGEAKFRSTPVLEREAKTDAGGSARLTLDPTIEPTAQPRQYRIEASVTGDDDIQVRSIETVAALPPFTLGVKVPRYLAQGGTIEPEILAVKPDGTPLPGLDMNVRLVRRNWTSVLQGSDFAQGSAKYVTQVMDETLIERKVTSTAEAMKLGFEAHEAGVYVVEVEASDRLGRRQLVSVDLFMGGSTPVTWSRPPAETVAVSTEKDGYAPGETATLVIQSPFQTARALAVVEEPEGRFRYDWVDIAGGVGRYPVTLRKEQGPRLAVHFLVMRGRLPGSAPTATAPFDQAKPVTVAATKFLKVLPVKNMVTAKFEAPARARPGEEVELTLRLSDDLGQPIAGEATVWMVDQAVLSLAPEALLDPLTFFLIARPTTLAARDTRNMALGVIPLEENPGGDLGEKSWGLENISVRKNFVPVPLYLPRVPVGPDGAAHIKVKLPDTLTVYKLRAKAVSGPDRFGYATGEMQIRQALVAQPALPRFARPGDRFDAGLIGRVVEGPGGGGRVTAAVTGASLAEAPEKALTWADGGSARVDFPVAVAEPAPGTAAMKLRFTLRRDADQAADAVELELPVRPDRRPVEDRAIADVAPRQSLPLPGLSAGARPGSFKRTVTVASDPALVRLVAALDALIAYPYGCTEQQMALAASALAVKPFGPILAAAGLTTRIGDSVKSAGRAIAAAIDDDGLVAFWPGSRGNVTLTAWSYRFLVAADKAGESVDKGLIDRLGKVLRQALRSDYPRFLAGQELTERVEALTALAEGGQLDSAYATELAHRAEALPNAVLAEATSALAGRGGPDHALVDGLVDALWSRVKLLTRDGRPVYAGLAGDSTDPLILPSEARSLAEMLRAATRAAPQDTRNPILRDALMRTGEGDGWGSTRADAAAIRALAESWRAGTGTQPVAVAAGGALETGTLGPDNPVFVRSAGEPAAGRIDNAGGKPLVALVDTRYMPLEPGSRAAPVTGGFVLSRSTYRVPGDHGPLVRLEPDADQTIGLMVGDVVEEAVELVNPEDRTHVAVTLPLAAGLEPLNPALATAPAEAVPSAGPTLAPTYTAMLDDHVLYAYDRLPKGNYRFFVRARAQTAGSFTEPPAEVETMYRLGLYGASAGQRVVIRRAP